MTVSKVTKHLRHSREGGNPVHVFGANDATLSIETTYARGLMFSVNVF
jgi:hypothetical protein